MTFGNVTTRGTDLNQMRVIIAARRAQIDMEYPTIYTMCTYGRWLYIRVRIITMWMAE